MRKTLLAALVLCTVALLLMPSTTFVRATTPPTTAEGTWVYIPTYREIIKIVDGNIFLYGEEKGTWKGTFVGTSDDAFTAVIHPTDSLIFQGLIHFFIPHLVLRLI